MFNDKPYSSVNREERFYCSLFAHALLTSDIVRQRFSELVNQRFGITLDPKRLEVFLEVAALRDYWNDLGDPKQYSPETHQRRRTVLNTILEMCSIDPIVIDQTDLFWTAGQGSKLWSPGRWGLKSLEDAKLGNLRSVRWAFNAKPDILVHSQKGALLLEAKIESGEGRSQVGYDQLETQRLIIELWKVLIPAFSRVPIKLATLKVTGDSVDGISWKDIVSMVNQSNVDDFTRSCLAGLARYQTLGAA